MSNCLGLFLMQQRGLAVLQALVNDRRIGRSSISFVVSAKDSNVAGDFYDQIKDLCQKENVQFYDRKESRSKVADMSLAVGWRWLIDDVDKLIVIHDSLLPKFRGFAPVVASLIEGASRIGATAFFASERYDEGPVLGQAAISISYPIKIEAALEALVPVFQLLATKVIADYLNGILKNGDVQIESDATYSLWRDKNDYRINWARDAQYLKRFVDAVGYPFAGAQTVLNSQPVKIIDCELYPDLVIADRQSHLGKSIFIEDGQPVVICNEGLLKITMLTDMDGKPLLPLLKMRSRFD